MINNIPSLSSAAYVSAASTGLVAFVGNMSLDERKNQFNKISKDQSIFENLTHITNAACGRMSSKTRIGVIATTVALATAGYLLQGDVNPGTPNTNSSIQALTSNISETPKENICGLPRELLESILRARTAANATLNANLTPPLSSNITASLPLNIKLKTPANIDLGTCPAPLLSSNKTASLALNKTLETPTKISVVPLLSSNKTTSYSLNGTGNNCANFVNNESKPKTTAALTSKTSHTSSSEFVEAARFAAVGTLAAAILSATT